MFNNKKPLLADNGGDYSAQLSRTNKVLLNIVLALFHKSYLKSQDKNFEARVIDTIDDYLPTVLAPEGSTAQVNTTLTDVIKNLIHRTDNTPVSVEWLDIQLSPLKVNHPATVNYLLASMRNIADIDEAKVRERYNVYVQLIYDYQAGFLVKLKARELFAKALNASEDNVSAILRTAFEEIEPYLVKKDDNPIISIKGVDDLVFGDSESDILDKFTEAAESVDPASVLKTGMQGWDRSLSDYQGILRGSFGEIQALSGHGKSDTARKLLRGVAMHNVPYMLDAAMKPALVYISLEDPTHRSMDKLVTQLRREEGDCYDLPTWTDEEKTAYYKAKMGINGYNVILVKARNKELTASGVQEILESIIARGYEIHLAMVDYMGCLDVSDIEEANNSECIKTAHSRVMNFTQSNKIATIVLNQIRGADYSKVLGVDSENKNDVVKYAVHQNLSAQSANIINVVDYRCLVNVIKGTNAAYHQWAMGKNRMGTSVSSRDTYAVYKMHSALGDDGVLRPAGFIKDDVGGSCMALRSTPDLLEEDSLDDDDGFSPDDF